MRQRFNLIFFITNRSWRLLVALVFLYLAVVGILLLLLRLRLRVHFLSQHFIGVSCGDQTGLFVEAGGFGRQSRALDYERIA